MTTTTPAPAAEPDPATATTRPCLVCGVAAAGPPIPVTLSVPYGPGAAPSKLIDAEMTRCAVCAERRAEVQRITDDTDDGKRLAARAGSVLLDRMERTLAGLSLLGVDAGKLTPATVCALTTHPPMSTAVGSLPFVGHARPGATNTTPFGHVTADQRARLRAAYADHLRVRMLVDAPAVRIGCPSGACMFCGATSVTLPASDVHRRGGAERAAGRVWTERRMTRGQLGGRGSPEPITGHLCTPCQRAAADAGALGPTARERAFLAWLDAPGRLRPDAVLDPVPVGYAARDRAAPNRRPWAHWIDDDGAAELRKRLGGER